MNKTINACRIIFGMLDNADDIGLRTNSGIFSMLPLKTGFEIWLPAKETALHTNPEFSLHPFIASEICAESLKSRYTLNDSPYIALPRIISGIYIVNTISPQIRNAESVLFILELSFLYNG